MFALCYGIAINDNNKIGKNVKQKKKTNTMSVEL